MTLSMEGVLALAPDESSIKAARGLQAPGGWPLLGASPRALWGECKGSGAKPYQTQVDLSGPAFRCSCPSRKFPCKHGLALLMLHVQQAALFQANSEPPAWVSEWLDARAEKAQKQESRAASSAPAAPSNPEAAAQRETQRWERITLAGQDLQRWLADQLNQGLGALNAQGLKTWQSMAARLVDAQAPGLAQRLREAAAGVHQGADWPERTLARLGLLQLACEALARRQDLAPATQAELRQLLGWPLERVDVLAGGERVDDAWSVLASFSEEREDRLTERRVWLHGESTGRRALLLDHAFAGRGFEQAWLVGSRQRAVLAFYPGSAGLRALCTDSPVQDGAARWPATELAQEWQALAERVAASPWQALQPMVLSKAVLLRAGTQWQIACEGQVLPASIPDTQAWQLLALQGGAALGLMGEWDGRTLRPLSVWSPAEPAPLWLLGAAS
ncbi:SWIM zinc finger family protein [Roseateles sp.]|uniref:SWIM zinc finger family protein n=1 Tax=Roseateles sp. TaxID=1971397 RepID=UPI003D110F40